MTRVYLDPSTLVLGAAGGPAASDETVAPRAADAIALLVDAGYEVVLLGDSPAALGPLPDGVSHESQLPEHLDADGWYLTAEPFARFGRPRGGTTVLVGPRRTVGKVPLPRFDLETRDLASAVMEILTRQAMA